MKVWNQWREAHPDIQPDLSGVNLSGKETNLSTANLTEANLTEALLRSANLFRAILTRANLTGTSLWKARLSGADLSRAVLTFADLDSAKLIGAKLIGAKLIGANLNNALLQGANLSNALLDEANLSTANLTEALLKGASLIHINLRGAHLNKANLQGADLFGAYLSWTDFSDADLRGASLFGAYLREANLSRANLSEANLSRANFFWPDIGVAKPSEPTVPWQLVKSWDAPSGANLSGANLSRANLSGADLCRANLSGANLSGANFSWANLSGANLSGADITGCCVYATSTWDVLLEKTTQANLILTAPADPGGSSITVDNLEVAQFIYLLLNNQKIRRVIDTITSKVVLILGRFSPERKLILDAVRNQLRAYDYLPVLFDFEKPTNRNFTETVKTLAHLAHFIIADLTDPSSIPQELQAIVPTLSVPVQPLLLKEKQEYAMFVDFLKTYHWVLPIYYYTDQANLLASLKERVIAPAEQKAMELAKG
jgi:uncharacterized protein YjbI with pentapeptide repeats